MALARRNDAMNGVSLGIRVLAGAALLAGCVNSQNTRLPRLG